MIQGADSMHKEYADKSRNTLEKHESFPILPWLLLMCAVADDPFRAHRNGHDIFLFSEGVNYARWKSKMV